MQRKKFTSKLGLKVTTLCQLTGVVLRSETDGCKCLMFLNMMFQKWVFLPTIVVLILIKLYYRSFCVVYQQRLVRLVMFSVIYSSL